MDGYYVDWVRRLEPFVDELVRNTALIGPDVGWTCAYILFLSWMYLFHSPFRVHTLSRTDWYAQVTKVLQGWSGITVILFHVLPFFLARAQRPTPSGDESQGSGSGSEAAASGMPHSRGMLEEDSLGQRLSVLFAGLSPDAKAEAETAPAFVFFPTFCLWSVMLMFSHKKKRDWHLGVTYGPTFTLVTLNAMLLALLSTVHYVYCNHFSPSMTHSVPYMVVCPLKFTVAPVVCILHLLTIDMVFLVLDYAYKKKCGYDPVRGLFWSELFDIRDETPQETGSASLQDWRLKEPQPRVVQDPKPAEWQCQTPSMAVGCGTGGVTAADCCDPFESVINHTEVCGCPSVGRFGISGKSTYRKSPLGATASGSEVPTVSFPPGNGDSFSTQDLTVDAAAERLNFAPPPEQIDALRRAKHPLNRPGMVAWFSTFIATTAVQQVLGMGLDFLTFDVRGIMEHKFPKVFTFTFDGAAFSTPASPLRTHAVLSGDDSQQRGAAEEQAPEASSDDVWFDWVGDVGDGFNPTYEMARLMAHPELRVTPDHVSYGSMTPLTSWYGGSVVHRVHLPTPRAAGSGRGTRKRLSSVSSSSSQQRRGPRSLSALPSGDRHAMSMNYDSSSSAASNRGGGTRGDGLPAGRKARRSSAPRVFGGRTSGGVAAPGLTAQSGRTLSRCSPLINAPEGDVPAVLPRGSFLLLGGDLAYPNANEETYRTRLVEVYKDALCGSRQLRELMRTREREVLHRDPMNPDVAHVTLASAASVAAAIRSGNTPVTVESIPRALRSTPLLFAIPGNHDWLDGLVTFRNFIIDKAWLGGWLMPQNSSYFLLKLPFNWFIICCDTGSRQDIDSTQRNYFLRATDHYMDADSCVILACHEPSWVYDAMSAYATRSIQPEINRLVVKLGTRLRLRLTGDIHHYSRHNPVDPFSDAAVLIVSGGGGAFMHGPLTTPVVTQGLHYKRTAAFPAKHTVMTIATRLFGFRLVNWQFDIIAGVLCFLLIASILPLKTEPMTGERELQTLSVLVTHSLGLTLDLVSYVFSSTLLSLFVFVMFFVTFVVVGQETQPLAFRLPYGLLWSLLVMFASASMLAALHSLLMYFQANGMILSTRERWGSMMEQQIRSNVDLFFNNSRLILGPNSEASARIALFQSLGYNSTLVNAIGIVARSTDVIENFMYLSFRVSSDTVGKFSPDCTRLEVILYVMHMILFYWLLATPLVSFIIGLFLYVSVRFFDMLYDAAYSAFQIEDYKHFVRFRISKEDRTLHGYVVAEMSVPKVWELSPHHAEEVASEARQNVPPHLRQNPSRWMPSKGKQHRLEGEDYHAPHIVDHFVVKPHRR